MGIPSRSTMQIEPNWMSPWAFGAAILAGLLVAADAVNLRSGRSEGREQFFAFDYSQHGQDWMAGMCTSRTRQSPIDLPAGAATTGVFTYKYELVQQPFDFLNNGHSFAADFGGAGYGGITYNGAWYSLLNINVHSVSEHSWAGVKTPLELHLVHKHYANENLLIVAIGIESPTPLATLTASLLQSNASVVGRQVPIVGVDLTYVEPPSTDPDFNAALQPLVKAKPPATNMKVSVPMDSKSFMDISTYMAAGEFYEYAGSLTAPPCTEIATWLVRKDFIKASDKQVLYLHDALYKTTADFGNYRALMPLNSRVIGLLQATLEDRPQSQQEEPSYGPPMHNEREFRAMKWSMDAMNIAEGATKYIKDLDTRLRNAASAHAEAMSAVLPPMDALSPAGEYPVAAQPSVSQYNKASPIQMDETAKAMAQSLANTAREQIEDATEEIRREAKQVALKAALEAAGVVQSGGNVGALPVAGTISVPSGLAASPAGPPPPMVR